MSVVTLLNETQKQLEKKKNRRRNRKIVKRIIQVAPCSTLLFLCSLVIHIQKQHVLNSDDASFREIYGHNNYNFQSQNFQNIPNNNNNNNNNNGLRTAQNIPPHNEEFIPLSDQNSTEEIHPKTGLSRYPYTGLADLVQPNSDLQTGFYWQIPRSGGTTLKHIISKCLNLVTASRTSVDYCDVERDDLHVCHTRLGSFINADTSDNHGIQRSIRINLIPSGMSDVIVSSRLVHALALFDTDHQARAFTVIRDPIDRIVSTFYYLQNAHWERNYNAKYKDMTLLEYVQGDDVSSDWMIRWLTGKQNEHFMTEQDLEFAKEILKEKFLVLVTDEMKTSVDRLIRFMGWEGKVDEESQKCIEEDVSKVGSHNKNLHPDVLVGSEAYDVMKEKNKLDIELYNFALGLFSDQWKLVPADKSMS